MYTRQYILHGKDMKNIKIFVNPNLKLETLNIIFVL